MSKASELIEQLSQYVEKPAQPVREEIEKTPGDEVEDLEINVVDEDKDKFHGLLNNFCNRYDPENKMTIKECVNQAFEDEPKEVDIFVNQLLQLEYREPEDFRNTKV